MPKPLFPEFPSLCDSMLGLGQQNFFASLKMDKKREPLIQKVLMTICAPLELAQIASSYTDCLLAWKLC